MVYKALLRTDVFSISYIKWYKFYKNNLLVVSGSKHGERWNSWPQTRVLSTLCQLNTEGGGELPEIKQCRDKTEIGKEIIQE